MPKFWFLIHARNVVLRGEAGKLDVGGFYVWRSGTGPCPETAQREAFRAVLTDHMYKGEVQNQTGDPPQLVVEEVTVDSPDTEGWEGSAIVFYTGDPVDPPRM